MSRNLLELRRLFRTLASIMTGNPALGRRRFTRRS
jgi:hypothetical protein